MIRRVVVGASAARELRQSYLCNPHDINSIKDALMRAVRADRSEAAKRMNAMRRYLRDHDVDVWASEFLSALGPPNDLRTADEPVGSAAV